MCGYSSEQMKLECVAGLPMSPHVFGSCIIAKRDAKRMSAKEVTINVTDSIRQVDRNRRMAKNCVN